ncbi:sigma-70 family RNA polymerase sigma factor [Saccharopolyspora sp. MS10]|uniref:sigma-70 family RNA polymerase sigma factor n=1 Tax=Saccharopolyspora sp. MS10 TaxID=3385973 RepID=UPI00399EF1F3
MLTSTLPIPVQQAAARHAHLPVPPLPAGTPTHPPAPEAGENWRHVRAAQDGDTDAFGKLYDEYAHVVYRYVLFRVSDHCLAEDITSETFLRALRRIATVSYQGRDVAAWFITIAKNLVLDHVKSSRARLEVPIPELTESQHRPQAQCGPEQHVLDAATQQELLRCVRQLNPDQRECIRLRFMQGLSVTETAQLMGRGEGAVKALQHRAVRRLAQLLPDDVR